MSYELHTAAESGDLVTVNRLLATGADPNAVNAEDETPLRLAAWLGHLDIVRSLLEHEANVNFATEHEMYTALMMASTHGQADIARALLDAGADVNARDDYDATALTRAAEYGYFDIVKMLLGAGADANVREERDMTALELAEASGHTSVAELIRPYTAGKSLFQRAVERIVGRERRERELQG